MATWKKVVVESAADTIAQDTTGNAGTATALETARNIALGGDLSGSANFDGSANITITAAVADDSHNHTISNVDGLQTALDAKQASDADLTAIAALAKTDGNFIVGNGSTWVAESGATARTSLGLGSLATKSAIVTGDITNGTILEADLNATNTPTDGYILSYDSSSTGFTWVANTAAANDSTVTLAAGAGLSGGGSFSTNQGSGSTVTFNVDFGEFSETAVTVADDYIVFLDGSGTGAERKESIADLVTAMTGTNLASQAGVIQLAANPNISGTLDVTGVATFDSNVTIAGNLTVTGSTTTVESTNLLVDDTFISLNDNATANADTGIVFGGADNKVFGWDNSQESGRFGVDYTGGNAAIAGGGFSPDGWVSVAHSNSAAPTDATNGDTDSLRQIGNIYVNSTNQDIYIYS